MEWIKEIRQGWRGLDPTGRDLRNLGLLFAAVCALIAGWLAWSGAGAWPWLVALAALWGAWGLAWPRGLKPIYLAWMGLALVLGAVVGRVLLTAVYYLVLTPIGLGLRLTGKDLLDARGRDRDSYWRTRPATDQDPRRTEKMY